MTWNQHEYDNIPGTYVFDGKRSNQGYRINKMAYSFNQADNREEFARDMDAYCRKFQLTDEEREAVLNADFLKLLQLGGNIYYLAKIAIFHGMSVQDACATMSGISTEQFKSRLLQNSEDFQQKIKAKGGFFDG